MAVIMEMQREDSLGKGAASKAHSKESKNTASKTNVESLPNKSKSLVNEVPASS